MLVAVVQPQLISLQLRILHFLRVDLHGKARHECLVCEGQMCDQRSRRDLSVELVTPLLQIAMDVDIRLVCLDNPVVNRQMHVVVDRKVFDQQDLGNAIQVVAKMKGDDIAGIE